MSEDKLSLCVTLSLNLPYILNKLVRLQLLQYIKGSEYKNMRIWFGGTVLAGQH